MRCRFPLFVLVACAAGASPIRADDASGSDCALPAGVQLPLPLYSPEPPSGGLYLAGGSWGGIGWRFKDGSDLGISWGKGMIGGIFYRRRAVCETETYRCTLATGTRAGVVHEWYLGDGFVVRLDLGGPFALAAVRLQWFPFEGVSFLLGWELMTGTCGWGWQFVF
jgi:hypothetical protein